MATKSERFELRIEEDQLVRVDEWAKTQPDQPTRAEAFRRLIQLGLTAGPNRPVHLSDGEKLISLMLIEMIKTTKTEDSELRPDFLEKVISSGHEWALSWEFPGLFDNRPTSQQEVSYVLDVLTMWEFIEKSFANLTATQKKTAISELGTSADNVRFPGFDGNEEAKSLSIARMFIENLDRFQIFKDREINSHWPTEIEYRRMLKLFAPMRNDLYGPHLNAQQLKTLLAPR